jgi:Ca-activated chloride channel family protein
MKGVFVFACICISTAMLAQQSNSSVRQANKLYKEKKFPEATAAYQQALAKEPDAITTYNLGNAFFRSTRFEEAAESFDRTARESGDSKLKQRATYNQGVSFSKQQKLEQSIEAYKKAVLLDPADQDARVNLQKALLEQKKKQPPQPKKEDDKKKQQNKNNQQQQKPRSNLTKKQVEQLLKALQQREQQVQQKMQQNRNRTAGQQEKDW